jgi:hypothetical protein
MCSSVPKSLWNLLWIPPLAVYVIIRFTYFYINFKWKLYRARRICRKTLERHGIKHEYLDELTRRLAPSISFRTLLTKFR